MTKLILSIGLLYILSGCHDDRPAGLIPRADMIQIMADIHIADAIAERQSPPERLDPTQVRAIYQRIYQARRVNEIQFRTSYKYYEARPDMMLSMYDEILSELSRRQAVAAKGS